MEHARGHTTRAWNTRGGIRQERGIHEGANDKSVEYTRGAYDKSVEYSIERQKTETQEELTQWEAGIVEKSKKGSLKN